MIVRARSGPVGPILGALFVLCLLVAPAAAQAPGGGGPPPAVTVVTVQQRDITLTADLPGRVVASGVAEVRPQVNGIITERLFQEGSDVALGQPLYRIDPDTYAAQVASAEAQIAQAQATLKAADREADRAAKLVRERVASQRTLDEAVAARDEAAAAVKVAQAALRSARIELDRTTIKAPLAGVIGRSLTTQGALVTSGQATPLAVIRTIDPVLVDVTQSAAEVLSWRRAKAGQSPSQVPAGSDAVRLTLADGKAYEHTGSLRAAEPNVNEQTGVVTLRLEFPNPDRLLLPGMYVRVVMPQGVVKDAVLAPQEGVSHDRRGRPTALVVGPDNTVEPRELTVVQAQGNDWVVSAGLKDGDRLIVKGLQKARPGAQVTPTEQGGDPNSPSGGNNAAPAASTN
ncbi:efflux RND transporter periplasmic adaptor subunit [Roseospirillum parvum]|uniref:Membrane fusion protein, multidrug efflux system n=1 Tax=Roseospirillum parvum TaxID=83401 RepID=A0A1G8EQX9_9PROT|nr:efflux RND transporter periplasmic adaptor subunit [Roseospirillum parvum]SDH72301.1 membrane fusion protein, multidrug efflux system [Roseospirillum parvum]